MTHPAVSTAVDLVNAPLLYKGKVRELYDLGEQTLIVVTDRISAFDYVLDPAVPEKGNVLNRLSAFWFGLTKDLMENHVVHIDVDQLGDIARDREALKNRIMVVRKAERIDIECVVRGCITGGAGGSTRRPAKLTESNCPKACAKTLYWPSRSSPLRPKMM